MNLLLICLSLFCSFSLNAQTGNKPILELQSFHNEPFLPSPAKMLCDPAAVGITDGKTKLNNLGGNAGAGGVLQLSDDLIDRSLAAGADTTCTRLSSETYEMALTDVNSDVASYSAIVSDIRVNITPTQPDCDSATGEASANVTSATGVVTYRWNTGETTQTINNLATMAAQT